MIDSSSIKIYGDNMMSQKLTSYLQNWQARQATARNTRKVWVVCRPLSAVLGRYHPYHTISYHRSYIPPFVIMYVFGTIIG